MRRGGAAGGRAGSAEQQPGAGTSGSGRCSIVPISTRTMCRRNASAVMWNSSRSPTRRHSASCTVRLEVTCAGLAGRERAEVVRADHAPRRRPTARPRPAPGMVQLEPAPQRIGPPGPGGCDRRSCGPGLARASKPGRRSAPQYGHVRRQPRLIARAATAAAATRTETTFAAACTPLSVRPATGSSAGSTPSAAASIAATVRNPGCTAHPRELGAVVGDGQPQFSTSGGSSLAAARLVVDQLHVHHRRGVAHAGAELDDAGVAARAAR